MTIASLKAGFADPVHDSQRNFRAILEAMAHPGHIVELASPPSEVPDGLAPAAATVALTLLDFETSLWLAGQNIAETRHWLAFHTGCRFTSMPDTAAFALLTDASVLPELADFSQGSDESPERSATIILQIDDLIARDGWRLSGPGIDGHCGLTATGVPSGLPDELRRNHAQFPRGVDLMLVAGMKLVALPRTTLVED